jgi:GntR family transcriptional repressor for pyruvate dehydrogenase complex
VSWPRTSACRQSATLAEELGVDRTSLRVALRQLSRMNLLRATQGSGITVLDYRRHAGIDFLAAVLEVPGLELGGAFLLEALDQWNVMMPRFVATALARCPARAPARDRRVLRGAAARAGRAGATERSCWTR